MIKKFTESIKSNFAGTVIDIETIGSFCDQYPDSRRYKDHQMVILGLINKHTIEIFCAEGKPSVAELLDKAPEILGRLEKPLYAFNSEFERGVFFYNLGLKISFEGELQFGRESKASACRQLSIPNYDDPFFDRGLYCMDAWIKGSFDSAIAHNRACLLKERDLLLKRGFKEPQQLKFVR
jgi:hypothetical protein